MENRQERLSAEDGESGSVPLTVRVLPEPNLQRVEFLLATRELIGRVTDLSSPIVKQKMRSSNRIVGIKTLSGFSVPSFILDAVVKRFLRQGLA
jgi:hypothetical protein